MLQSETQLSGRRFLMGMSHISFVNIMCTDQLWSRTRIASDAQHGLISQVLKDIIFSKRLGEPQQLAKVIDVSVVES